MAFRNNKELAEKVPKSSVDFRRAGATGPRCGTCSMFRGPSSCTYVLGTIRPNDLCDAYDPRTGVSN